MEQPYDPTLKTLTELSPSYWLPLAGRRRRRVSIENSDIATIVSGAGDKLFRVHDDPEYLLHLDFEAGHFRSELPLRLRLYNSVYEYRHNLLALSVPVLLRPEADSPQWSGLLERGFAGEPTLSSLRYHVIRVWELDPNVLLRGGVGTLALAPISAVAPDKVPGVIRQVKQRLTGRHAPRKAKDVLAATYVLLGLRYTDQVAHALFEEVLGMEESATYQAIVRRGREQGLAEGRSEGRAEGARRLLFLLGEDKFGPPDPATRAALDAISDMSRLDELAHRISSSTSWQDLLPTPPRSRRARRRPNGA
jgi:predicted transposase YdaD